MVLKSSLCESGFSLLASYRAASFASARFAVAGDAREGGGGFGLYVVGFR